MVQKCFTSSQKTSESMFFFCWVLCMAFTMCLGCSQCRPTLTPCLSRSVSHLTSCVMSLFTHYVDSVFPIHLATALGHRGSNLKESHQCTYTQSPPAQAHKLLFVLHSIILNKKLSPWEVLSKYLAAFFGTSINI